jgi:hypothetical protein
MKIFSWKRLITIAVITIIGFIFFYLNLPKENYAIIDDNILFNKNFLVNASICINDFRSKKGRNPNNLQELFSTYKDLERFYATMLTNTNVHYFPDEKSNSIIRIENQSSKVHNNSLVTIELTKEGKIIVTPN